ncbi:GNAT family acetyltransferase, partial [Staphylococcus aureus]
GRRIKEHILQYIKGVAVQGTYGCLIAEYPPVNFYTKIGFITNVPDSRGMDMKY